MALDEHNERRGELVSHLDARGGFRVGRRSSRTSLPRVSCSVMSHWGEIVQGPVDINGRPQIGLVTLPDPTRWVTAFAMRRRHGPTVSCDQPWKAKALHAARLAIEKWAPGTSLQIDLQSTIPEGVGAGSSTADCTATVCAIRELLGIPRSEELAVLSVIAAAEGPCDPLLLLNGHTTLLWGSRSGQLLKQYDLPLPSFHAVGFVTDPGRTVLTVELAAQQRQHPPTPRELDAFAGILRDFEHALHAHSANGVAQAAMASGSLNQSRCPIDGWDALMRLAEGVGALGVSCAHSGTAAAMLFDPALDDLAERCDHATRQLQELRVAHMHQFRTDAMPPFWSAPDERAIES